MPIALPWSLCRQQQALVGLDIGLHALRLVELSRQGTAAPTLERYDSEDLPHGAVSNHGIEDLGQVMAAARRLWSRCNSDAMRLALGIPFDAVAIHTFSIADSAENRAPPTDMDLQLEALARMHVAPLLDYPLAEAGIDFAVIASSGHPAPGKLTLLVVTTHQNNIDDRIAVAESLQLQAQVADIDSHAACAALLRSHPPVPPARACPLALLQMDLHSTRLSLFDDERVITEQEYAFGHHHLIRSIQDAYGMSQEEAEQQRREDRLPTACADILAPYLAHTAAMVASELIALLSRHPDLRPERLFLAGCGASTTGLADVIADATDIATQVAAPFDGMALAPGIDADRLGAQAPAYLVACGLALRAFD